MVDRGENDFTLNKMLPYEIGIHDVYSVHDDAHARFDAVSRQYTYKIHTERSILALFLVLHIRWFIPRCFEWGGTFTLEYSDFNTFVSHILMLKHYLSK